MKDNTDNLRTEYIEVGANWRFLVDVRFKMLGFFLTLITGLGIAFTFSEDDAVRGVIYIAGLVSSFSIWIMELRNRTLYRTILERGVELELLLKIIDGQYQRLQQSWKKDTKKGFIFTQSNVIDTLCITIIILWLYVIFIPMVKNQSYMIFLSMIVILIMAFMIYRRNISMGRKMETQEINRKK